MTSTGLWKDARELLVTAGRRARIGRRTSTYFEHADRFAAVFLGGLLEISVEERRAVGVDIPIILDDCYEELGRSGEAAISAAAEMTRRLQRMVDPRHVEGALPALRRALDSEQRSTVDIASALLAGAVACGHAELSRKVSVGAADEWASLWGQQVRRHNEQQEMQVRWAASSPSFEAGRGALLAGANGPPGSLRSFSEAVTEYLSAFSDTAAASMSLVGSLPFACRFSEDSHRELVEFFGAAPDLLQAMNEILRLAQDVRFDPSEALSCGVFALSVERGSDARDLGAEARSVGQRLVAEWQIRAETARGRMEASLVKLPEGAVRRTVAGLIETTLGMGRALMAAPHKGG